MTEDISCGCLSVLGGSKKNVKDIVELNKLVYYTFQDKKATITYVVDIWLLFF